MKKIIVFAISALLLTSCTKDFVTTTPLEKWENYGDENPNQHQNGNNYSNVVIYRPSSFEGSAVNIYANGDYQASLISSSFTQMKLCSSNQLITASFSSPYKFGNRTEGNRYDLPTKGVAYFRVNSDLSDIVLEPVPENIAKNEILGLKRATNTISRVTKLNCSNFK